MKRLKTLLLVAACLFTVPPASAEIEEREGSVIALLGDSHRVDLVRGQSIIFRPDKGKMAQIRFVEGPMEPGEGELRLDFAGLDKTSKLMVKSRADKAYSFRAAIIKMLGAKKGKPTMVCTIIAGGNASKSWPGDISYLRISEFNPTAADQSSC